MKSKKDFRIVFMGTPEFAAHILDKLVQENYQVVAVVTAPDKPAGRGQQLHESDVKKYAVSNNLPVLQPEKLKDEQFLDTLRSLEADLFVVVAFRMLPEVVWSMPPQGTINLHASILPDYRGAAPINWAVINGEEETGVTTFFIEKEIDTGKVIERERVKIGENETVGELHDRLMELGANVTASTVEKIRLDQAEGIEQLHLTDKALKSAPKIFKQDCLINWNQPVETVHNFVRGLSPYPAAWCKLENIQKGETKTYKLFASEKTTKPVEDHLSLKITKEGIFFPCSDFYLLIREIQPEGKRKMTYKEFLAGNQAEDLRITAQ